MKRQVVFLGQIGSGKTTLFNKICNTNLKTQAGGESCTRKVFLRHSAYGAGFKALDTPGFGSDKQLLIHAAAIIAALQEGPVDRIILVVKFDRTALMKESIKQALLPIKRYANLITFLITNWDKSESPKQDELKLQKEICSYFNINSYILSGLNTKPDIICQQIEATFSNQQIGGTSVNIHNSEIQGCFDLLEEQQKPFEIVSEIDDCEQEFKKLCLQVEKFISTYDRKAPDLDEVMHAIIQWLKRVAEDKINAFEQRQSQKLNQIYSATQDEVLAYLFHVELKKALSKDLQRTIQMASDMMRFKPDHPFNKIKQCPNPKCQLIWLKVYGCEGNTTCGNFPEKDYGGSFSQLLKYKIFFNNNTLQIIKEAPLQQTKTNYDVNNQKRLFVEQKGCGTSFKWSELPPLTEGQLKELNDSGILDFLTDKREQNYKSRNVDYKVQSEILKQKSQIDYE